MSRAEKFIKDYTRNCSNAYWDKNGGDSYFPWLTPDDAIKAVEIAREEMLNDMCEWLDKHLIDYWSQSVTDGSGFIEDLKKHFEPLEP